MDIYQLKITLQGIRKPAIWRRVRIPAIVPFETLHTVIQETMGWQGYHLYEFSDIRKEGDYNRSWRVTDPKRLGRRLRRRNAGYSECEDRQILEKAGRQHHVYV